MEYISQKNEMIEEGCTLGELIPPKPDENNIAEKTLHGALKYLTIHAEKQAREGEPEPIFYELMETTGVYNLMLGSKGWRERFSSYKQNLTITEHMERKINFLSVPALFYLPFFLGRKTLSRVLLKINNALGAPQEINQYFETAIAAKSVMPSFKGRIAAERQQILNVYEKRYDMLMKCLEGFYLSHGGNFFMNAKKLEQKLKEKLYF